MIEDLELFLFSVSCGYLGLVHFINERSLYRLPEILTQPGCRPSESPEQRRGLGRELAELACSSRLTPHPCS